jgi:hypothetical protein
MLFPEFPKVVELLLMHYLLQKEVIIDFNLFKLLFILIVATSDIPFIHKIPCLKQTLKKVNQATQVRSSRHN